MSTILKIPKEQLSELKWSNSDVLSNPADRSIRQANLHRALLLGNTEKIKAKISFQTREGEEMMVETTVWALTENFVCLKRGILLPVRAVLQVDI